MQALITRYLDRLKAPADALDTARGQGYKISRKKHEHQWLLHYINVMMRRNTANPGYNTCMVLKLQAAFLHYQAGDLLI